MNEEKRKECIAIMEDGIPIVQKTGIKVLEFRERYAKLLLPFEKNVNHVGIIYAGSLFTLGDMAGGAIYHAAFDNKKFYPIVKDVSIRFKRMATTDVTIEVSMSEADAKKIATQAENEGKADFSLNLEIKDVKGETCCIVTGTWQLRKNNP
jgi:thioesterase domain-containing protein